VPITVLKNWCAMRRFLSVDAASPRRLTRRHAQGQAVRPGATYKFPDGSSSNDVKDRARPGPAVRVRRTIRAHAAPPNDPLNFDRITFYCAQLQHQVATRGASTGGVPIQVPAPTAAPAPSLQAMSAVGRMDAYNPPAATNIAECRSSLKLVPARSETDRRKFGCLSGSVECPLFPWHPWTPNDGSRPRAAAAKCHVQCA
jgi:hypothetical protein